METKNPRCSHCGYELDDDELWHENHKIGRVDKRDGEVSELKCPSCGKTFYVCCIHRITFDQTDEEGNEI